MDGRILENNLRRMGFDLNWLNDRLNEHQVESARNVFLALCDQNGKFIVFENREISH